MGIDISDVLVYVYVYCGEYIYVSYLLKESECLFLKLFGSCGLLPSFWRVSGKLDFGPTRVPAPFRGASFYWLWSSALLAAAVLEWAALWWHFLAAAGACCCSCLDWWWTLHLPRWQGEIISWWTSAGGSASTVHEQQHWSCCHIGPGDQPTSGCAGFLGSKPKNPWNWFLSQFWVGKLHWTGAFGSGAATISELFWRKSGSLDCGVGLRSAGSQHSQRVVGGGFITIAGDSGFFEDSCCWWVDSLSSAS